MSEESDRKAIRFAVDVFILACKTGKLKLLLEIILQGIRAKLSWDMMMERLNGEFYTKQVRAAVLDYQNKHSEDFRTAIRGELADGYEKWCRENPEEDPR